MPKRDATSELNHDNWDKEDESEEAGEFKKASEDQMKVWCVFKYLKVHFLSCFLGKKLPNYGDYQLQNYKMRLLPLSIWVE